MWVREGASSSKAASKTKGVVPKGRGGWMGETSLLGVGVHCRGKLSSVDSFVEVRGTATVEARPQGRGPGERSTRRRRGRQSRRRRCPPPRPGGPASMARAVSAPWRAD